MEIKHFKIGENGAVLTAYIQHGAPSIKNSTRRPAVLVLAGGGYEAVSDAEKEPVALAYAAKGFQSFTLTYSVGEKGVFPQPQIEAARSMAFLRKNSAELMLDADKIAVIGFSAGGHLAASICVHGDKPWLCEAAESTQEAITPNAAVLMYPCITASERAYEGILNVHGKGLADREKALLDLHKYVGKHTPPTYLCHTFDDPVVPVANSILYAQALAESGVPFEIRVMKNGSHGMSLATSAVTPNIENLPPAMQEIVRQPKVIAHFKKCAQRFSAWFEESVQFLSDCFEA